MESVWYLGWASSLSLAYIGPGAGLSALGALLALVFALVVALIGFVWYPVRRLIKYFRGQKDADGASST